MEIRKFLPKEYTIDQVEQQLAVILSGIRKSGEQIERLIQNVSQETMTKARNILDDPKLTQEQKDLRIEELLKVFESTVEVLHRLT